MDITAIVGRQRKFFCSGTTRDEAFRRQALRTLSLSLKEYEAELIAALHEDLHKSEAEAYLTEISIVYDEIKYALRHLHGMMRPKRAGFSLKTFPSRGFVMAEPLGVALIMSPWNYPVNLLLSPLVGAISAGCTAVVKSAEETPHVNEVLGRIISRSFDADYIAYISGGYQANVELLAQRWDMIFFTGSPRMGRVVMEAASRTLTPCVLELGGKSPCVVDKDADVGAAARRIMWGKLLNAGQTCIAPDYLLVHSEVKAALLSAMGREVERMYGGNPQDSDCYCRIITKDAARRLERMIKETKGAVVFGGGVSVDDRYVAPTVIDGVALDEPLMEEEIFGPVLPVVQFDSLEDAVSFIVGGERPLAAYYFGSRQGEEHFIKSVVSGGMCLNDTIMHITSGEMPFGGVGNSGMGRYHHRESFYAFSNRKSVLRSPLWFDVAAKYPPFKGFRFLRKLF